MFNSKWVKRIFSHLKQTAQVFDVTDSKEEVQSREYSQYVEEAHSSEGFQSFYEPQSMEEAQLLVETLFAEGEVLEYGHGNEYDCQNDSYYDDEYDSPEGEENYWW